MRRLLVVAAVMVAALVSVGAYSGSAASQARHRRGCAKLVTVRMGQRAARAIYADTRHVSRHELRVLGYIERCQRNPRAQWYVRWYDRDQGVRHDQRVYDASRPYSSGVASWYDDSGSTASGWHSYYGFATCGSGGGPCYSFGTRVEFCYAGRCVTAVADDHGPYVAGRDFDVNQNVEAVLRFDGVATVSYRAVG